MNGISSRRTGSCFASKIRLSLDAVTSTAFKTMNGAQIMMLKGT
jgi:hypothetical protein